MNWKKGKVKRKMKIKTKIRVRETKTAYVPCVPNENQSSAWYY